MSLKRQSAQPSQPFLVSSRSLHSSTVNKMNSGGSMKPFRTRANVADTITVEVLDRNGTKVAEGADLVGSLQVSNVQLWWPFSMSHEEYAYLYTLVVSNNNVDSV